MADPKEQTTSGQSSDSKRKGRSPSYPGINLETALDHAKAIHEAEHQHAAPEGSGTLSPNGGDKGVEKIMRPIEQVLGESTVATVRDIPIPIAAGHWPTLRMTVPMSREAWDQMIAVLEAMKPGLVKKPKPEKFQTDPLPFYR